ncbi:hypothetical protein [Pollutibacter soli]|uniref:hypothetical protein n=1 Tax=Pollutibacter soli TaxID=3034157 RepID=UPI00301355C7
MVLHIKIAGILMILLTFMHVWFPKYFRWKEELKRLSLVNRQMMAVHTFFIAIVLLMMALLCLTSPDELVQTSLGKTISLGFGIFWAIRLFIQFFGYSEKLWKGKRFETFVHVAFSIIWLYFSVVFFANYVKGS